LRNRSLIRDVDEYPLQDVHEQPPAATVAVPGEPTLQVLYDQLAIHQLIADRAYTYDEQDAEGFGALFVPDGRVELFYPGEATPAVRFETRAEIIEGMRRYFAGAPFSLLTRTHFSSIRFDALEPNWALVRGIFLITGQTQEREEPVPLGSGVAEWEFERTAAGWRFGRASGYNDQRRWFNRPLPS
jgi:hypothetical protein